MMTVPLNCAEVALEGLTGQFPRCLRGGNLVLCHRSRGTESLEWQLEILQRKLYGDAKKGSRGLLGDLGALLCRVRGALLRYALLCPLAPPALRPPASRPGRQLVSRPP